MEETVARQSRYRWLPVLVGLGFFALLGLIRLVAGLRVYRAIGKALGIDLWEFPFLDTDTVLSAVRCIRQGVDVYVANPCDPLARVFDYSPAWMVLRVFPMTIGWLWPIGVLVDLGLVAALLMMPGARTKGGAWLIALSVISSAALFAVERGNNDLVLFLLAAGAATLAVRSGAARFVGYALAFVAGLLKYYPMVVMAIAARERPAKLAVVTGISVLALAVFLALCWDDLTRALALIPTGDYFGDMFGSVTVAGGLADRGLLSPALAGALRWIMTVIALGVALVWALRPGLADQLATLDRRERAFLMVGALLIIGCFFSAQNIGYRAIHLILTLPALLVIRRRAAVIALVLLWGEGWRHLLRVIGKALGPDGLAVTTWIGWTVREGLWWWLVTMLLACVFAWLWRSEAATAIRARFGAGSPALPL